MESTIRSRTGELAAIMRAIHQIADDEPKIFSDPVAVRLVEATAEHNELFTSMLSHSFAKQWRSGFLARSRYAEDCLEEFVERGGRQYAILGAGLDTFAFRQPKWASALSIYEIDHPETQRWKRDRLATAGIGIPPNLTFVPIDFERVSLAHALQIANFDSNGKILFSWLGVTQYLTLDAISATLNVVLSLPRSSELVFSFILPSEMLPKGEAEARSMAAQKVAQIGEPYLSAFRADDLAGRLRAMGFSEVIHLTPDKVHERYFKNRTDGLAARFGEQLMRAIV